MTVGDLVDAASPLFCLFVLALGVVVAAVVDHGLGALLGALLPHGAGLLALLAIAGIAAVLANLINNLPAVLALLPLLAAAGPGPVLARLIGVNLGPNLTYVGSLATLLWRRILQEHDHDAELGEFTRVGLVTVPATLLGGDGAAVGGADDDGRLTAWPGRRSCGWRRGPGRRASTPPAPGCPTATRSCCCTCRQRDGGRTRRAGRAARARAGAAATRPSLDALSAEAAPTLLERAAQRLGRPARIEQRSGRVEREVVAAADGR